MLVSKAWVTARGHVDVHGLYCLLPVAMLMSVAYAIVKGYVGICGPAAARGQVDVHGPYCHLGSIGRPWSMLPPETVFLTMGWTSARNHIVSVVHDIPKACTSCC